MDFWLAGFIAFFIAFITTPLVIKIAPFFGWLDSPSRPHPAILHNKPLPRAGGIPPLIGFLVSLLILSFISNFFSISKQIWGIIIASVLLVAVGTFDDRFDLNPYFRLLTNIVVVAIVVASGIGITWFTNPFGGQIRLDSWIIAFDLPKEFLLFAGHHTLVVFADLLAFVWIIWAMNALNWSSGVDGQLTGIATIALSVLGIASSQLFLRDPSQGTVAVVAFAAAGSFLGILPWTFFPQKIMPGYGGSTLAGFLIAVLAIVSGAKLATALLILLIPLVDSFWAIIRRVSKGRSPVWGDRFHFHHQLLAMGWSIPKICLLYYSLGLVLGLLALSFDSAAKFFALVILGVIFFAFLLTLFIIFSKFKKNAI